MANPPEGPPVDEAKGLHRIEDELTEDWLEEWAQAGIARLEESLGKHAAFLAFAEKYDQTESSGDQP